jgi:hypothetical protein
MKNFLLAMCIAFASVGCQSAGEVNGREVDCVGAFEEKSPRYKYKVATWNIIGGVVFSEMAFIPPLYVILSATHCPVAEKGEAPLRN